MSEIAPARGENQGEAMYGLIQQWMTGEVMPVLGEYLRLFAEANPDWEYTIEGPVQYLRISILVEVSLKSHVCRKRNPRLVTLQNFSLDESDFSFLEEKMAGIPLLDEQILFRRKSANGRTLVYEIRQKDKKPFARAAYKQRGK